MYAAVRHGCAENSLRLESLCQSEALAHESKTIKQRPWVKRFRARLERPQNQVNSKPFIAISRSPLRTKNIKYYCQQKHQRLSCQTASTDLYQTFRLQSKRVECPNGNASGGGQRQGLSRRTNCKHTSAEASAISESYRTPGEQKFAYAMSYARKRSDFRLMECQLLAQTAETNEDFRPLQTDTPSTLQGSGDSSSPAFDFPTQRFPASGAEKSRSGEPDGGNDFKLQRQLGLTASLW